METNTLPHDKITYAKVGTEVQGQDGNSIGAQLDALPVGSFHYKLIGVIGAGLFLDAFEFALAGGVLGALAKTGGAVCI